MGTVYEIEHVTNAETDVLVFKVRFNYNDLDYEIHNDNMTIDNRYRLHQNVKVMFLDNSPEGAIIDDSKENGYSLILIIGLVVLTFAAFLFRAEKRFTVKYL
jgi:hypothetical protein